MFFLKRKPRTNETLEVTPEVQDTKLKVEANKEDPQEIAPNLSFDGSPSLFKKMFSFSASNISYENEAWVPEYESVGLFRKRRASFEEANSSITDAQ